MFHEEQFLFHKVKCYKINKDLMLLAAQFLSLQVQYYMMNKDLLYHQHLFKILLAIKIPPIIYLRNCFIPIKSIHLNYTHICLLDINYIQHFLIRSFIQVLHNQQPFVRIFDQVHYNQQLFIHILFQVHYNLQLFIHI